MAYCFLRAGLCAQSFSCVTSFNLQENPIWCFLFSLFLIVKDIVALEGRDMELEEIK